MFLYKKNLIFNMLIEFLLWEKIYRISYKFNYVRTKL